MIHVPAPHRLDDLELPAKQHTLPRSPGRSGAGALVEMLVCSVTYPYQMVLDSDALLEHPDADEIGATEDEMIYLCPHCGVRFRDGERGKG